jgi:flagellar biosynthesis/type III secretory pathway chaperone
MEYLGGSKWELMEVHHHGGFKSNRPVAEKKAIKTVAKVAAVAAAVYYGGPFLAGATGVGTTTAAAYGSLGALEAGSALGAAIGGASGLMSAGGLALQGVGMIQSNAAAQQMQESEQARVVAANEVQVSQERQSNLNAQRARIAQVREMNIRRGNLLASAVRSGTGTTGTSATIGSGGSLSTQLGANIGFINQAQSFASEQSAGNVTASNAASSTYQSSNEAAGWTSLASLGKDISTQFGGIKTIFSA